MRHVDRQLRSDRPLGRAAMAALLAAIGLSLGWTLFLVSAGLRGWGVIE